MAPVVNERKVKNNSEITALKGLIENHIKRIEELASVLSEKKDSYSAKLDSSSAYQEANNKVADANEHRKNIKEQVEKDSEITKLKQEIKDHNFDLKESKKTLSDLLIDYKGQAKSNQLELFDGKVFDIVENAKIVRNYK